MGKLAKWWTAVTTAVTCAVLIPAVAWAADTDVVVEAAKARRGRFGGLVLVGGGICCLLVVAIAVSIVVVIIRRRRK